MASIHFYTEKITFKIPSPRKTVNWLNAICLLEKRELGSLIYVFCSDKFLLELNKQYLGHKTYTDILSFDYGEGKKVEGEIFISISRVKENARNYGQVFDVELRRVIAHGLLHFLGYRDKKSSEKVQMRRKEEACLSLWK